MKRGIYIAVSAICLTIIVLTLTLHPEGRTTEEQNNNEIQNKQKSLEETNSEQNQEQTNTQTTWRNTQLTDVKTQETFTIEEYTGKTILIESFAVWCPKCKQQQDEMKKLIEEYQDESIHIAINTDQNEDETKVLEHINKHGYTWKYTVFPTEATNSLIEEFGIGIINAPTTPVILICPNGNTKQLDRGIKTAETLQQEIQNC